MLQKYNWSPMVRKPLRLTWLVNDDIPHLIQIDVALAEAQFVKMSVWSLSRKEC